MVSVARAIGYLNRAGLTAPRKKKWGLLDLMTKTEFDSSPKSEPTVYADSFSWEQNDDVYFYMPENGMKILKSKEPAAGHYRINSSGNCPQKELLVTLKDHYKLIRAKSSTKIFTLHTKSSKN